MSAAAQMASTEICDDEPQKKSATSNLHRKTILSPGGFEGAYGEQARFGKIAGPPTYADQQILYKNDLRNEKWPINAHKRLVAWISHRLRNLKP